MVYKGNAVSKGVAVGPVFHYKPFVPVVKQIAVSCERVNDELARYEASRQKAGQELETIRQNLMRDDTEKAKIITAHIDILYDVAIDEEVKEKITEDHYNAEWAVDKIFSKYIKVLGKAKDELIRERAADMKDVRTRLLRCMQGGEACSLSDLQRPVVVVANDLFPSDTASMDRTRVLAIVTETGGATSHTAIIARSYEIPAILGVQDAMAQLEEGSIVAVDALEGCVISQLDSCQIEQYEKKKQDWKKKAQDIRQYLTSEPRMADGTFIDLELNIGNANPQELEGARFTEGVGLFRSEFLYMGRETLPTEEEQLQIYTKVLLAFGDRPVTLRTLDIGGDKKLDCMQLPKEDNPFLGNRALRLCLNYPEIFNTQLRAALRASVNGNLWIMFPMVGSLDDIRRAKEAVQRAKNELDAEKIPYNSDVKIGIMIEIPSIALIADLAAQQVDFASIGTNDLCQYTTAVDRMNPAVAEYYQNYHPAMFRLIRRVVEEFNKAHKPICVCGELGGDPLAMPVLLGFGMRKISMGAASVAQCKKVIRGLTVEKAEQLASRVCGMSTASEIEAYLKQELAELL